MRRETLLLMMVTASVALAGCFGGNGGGGSVEGVQRDCGVQKWTLTVTQTTNAQIPLYTLSDGVTEQKVVALGFQSIESGGNPVDLEVPNPTIRLKECQTLELKIINANPMPHTFHLHGGLVDWKMDGVPFVSQMPIAPQGGEFTYVYEDLKAGTYWYHCHVDTAHHIDLGMYGAFIVEEWEPTYPYDDEFVLMLDEFDNCHIHGGSQPPPREDTGGIRDDQECTDRQFQDTYSSGAYWSQTNAARDPACNTPDLPQELYDALKCGANVPPDQAIREWYPMTFPLYNPLYNTFTINGKAFPDTEPIFFEEGKTYKIRLINVGEEWHSMHLHGHNFLITHRDGYEDPAPQRADTISIGPGERYDLLVEADNPGFWVYHDHVGLNTMNDHVSPGGMFTVIGYLGDFADEVGFAPQAEMTAMDVVDFTIGYHMSHMSHAGMGGTSDPTATPLVASKVDGHTVLHSQAVDV